MIVRVLNNSLLISELNILNEDIVNGGEVFIGREDDCHIVLNSHQVSRYHSSIQVEEGILVFKVLSDYGGVSHNGAPVTTKEVHENDIFKVFNFELHLCELPTIQSIPSTTKIDSGSSDGLQGVDAFDDLGINDSQMADEDFLSPESEVDDSSDLLAGVAGAEGLDEYNDIGENQIGGDDLNATEVYMEDPVDNKTEVYASDYESENKIDPSLTDSFSSTDGSNEAHETEFNEFRSENYEDDDFLNQDYSDDESATLDEGEAADGEIQTQDFNEPDYKDPESDEEVDNFDFGSAEVTESEFESGEADFGDGFGGADAGFGGDDGSATQVLSSFANYYLELTGEFAPFDKFQVTELETFIGRDPEKCHIILDDPEVSKIHAVIKKSVIGCVLEDYNSSNGIIYNGERVNKAELVNDDEFLIGDTAFSVIITSDIIEVEKDRLMPVAENQEVEIEEIVEEEVDYDQFGKEGEGFGEEQEKSLLKRIWKDKRKRFYLIVGVGLLLLMVLLGEDTDDTNKKVTKVEPKKEEIKPKNQFSPEIMEKLEQNYTLALAKSEAGEYYEAKEYIDIVMQIDPDYREGNARILSKLIQEGYDKLIKLREEEQERIERLEIQAKIAGLLEKATKAVEDRNVAAARKLFGMILELDPENPEVTPLKIDIDAWEAEEKRKKEEAALARARRQSMLDKLAPGKTLFIKQNWYKAIDKLEKFLKIEGMDEDLTKEAASMLSESRAKLMEQIDPLLSKARSFKDGQDLKQAYETYDEVLRFEPSNEEALNEKSAIYALLLNRSKKVYREALVAESLSLYPKAKEKFQEVQQISPINSKYYIKATEKLKNYLE